MINDDETNTKEVADEYIELLASICCSVSVDAYKRRSEEDPASWKDDQEIWDGQVLWAFCCSQKKKELEDKLAADDKLPAWSTMTKMSSQGVKEVNAKAFVQTCINIVYQKSVKDFLDALIIFVDEHPKFESEKIDAFKDFDELISSVLERWKLEKAIKASEQQSEGFRVEDTPKLISPFKSLNHFDFDDAPHFFGRKNETEAIVNRINDVAFYALMGISGTGKSSLALAGVAHALVQTNQWHYVSFRVTSYDSHEHQPFKSLSLGEIF